MATWVGLPRSYTPGRPRPIQYAVIHTTEGGEGSTSAEDGAAYDKTRTDGTSTHLFVDSNSAVREVRDADQAHAARQHGNAIGIQVELCGRAGQTWAQWHDAASAAELALAAREMAQICKDHGLPPVHLSVEQVRAAYYAPEGQRPKGICSHRDVTAAYPEDGGTHTDPGPSFPWSEFLTMVSVELTRLEEEQMGFMADPDAAAMAWRVEALINNRPTVAAGPTKGEVNALHDAIAAIGTAAGMSPEQVASLTGAVTAAAREGATEGIDGATVTFHAE